MKFKSLLYQQQYNYDTKTREDIEGNKIGVEISHGPRMIRINSMTWMTLENVLFKNDPKAWR